ncbi:MAG: hypothetical protein IJT80_08380 [Lachnospiraceae bacterium]|nr:hypothetical protein [Lachnospiraceae bacterium]
MAGLSRLDSAYLRMQTNDYSTLFNSMNRSSSSGSFNMFDVSGKSNNSLSANFYADYASLKNGSYFKLAKSYYGKQASETDTSKVTDKDKASDTKKTAETATDTKKTEEAAKPDYAKAASEISQEAKALGGYSAGGLYGSVDTSGILFNSVT